jgi:predicted Zn-dependent peptidase
MSQTSKKLENGMLIASDRMDSIETVSVSVLVKTGSRYEDEKNNGISHFLEHMAFKGTATRNAKQIAEEFDKIGGHFNAYTSREKTVYYAKVLKNDLETAVDILSDILQNSTYDQAELDRERGVILEEMKMVADTPDEQVFEHFQECAYPNQPFGRSILGTVDIIKSVTRDDIVKYVNDHYRFNNIIIAGAGNLQQESFEQLIESKFSNFAGQYTTTKEAAKYQGGDVRIEKDLEQVQFVLGFDGVPYQDKDYYNQQILSIVAGGGMSSRLFQEVREKRGLCYTISAFGSSYTDCGMFSIYAGTSDTTANELIDVTAAELLKLTSDIHEDEILRAKAQLRAGLLMSQESSVARAEKLAGNHSVYGRYVPVSEIIEKIEKVDVASVQNFASKIFSKDMRPTVASMGKISKLYSYEEIVKKLTA